MDEQNPGLVAISPWLAVGVVLVPEFVGQQQHFPYFLVLALWAAFLQFFYASVSGSLTWCQAQIQGNPEQISLQSCVMLVEVKESFPAALQGNPALCKIQGLNVSEKIPTDFSWAGFGLALKAQSAGAEPSSAAPFPALEPQD